MNGIRRVVLLCLMIGGSLLAAGQVATAATPVRFGAGLNTNLFPDNAYQGKLCDDVINGGSATYSCTWIENQAINYNGNGYVGARAPKDGTINRIRLIAGHGGSFRLFLARYKPATQQGKVVKAGPTITYQTDACSPDCHIQSFSISPLSVHQGDVLAIKTNKTSILRCNSGSPAISVYNPPLAVGGAFTTADATDGCYMLLQAQYE